MFPVKESVHNLFNLSSFSSQPGLMAPTAGVWVLDAHSVWRVRGARRRVWSTADRKAGGS